MDHRYQTPPIVASQNLNPTATPYVPFTYQTQG
jgi:hypothetical protein